MFINPKTAIKEGWITGVKETDSNVQPNAIDFTLDRLFSINHDATFYLYNNGKTMRGGNEIFADSNGIWELEPKTCYDGLSAMYVDLPVGVACELVIRSTLNRNGIFLTSGIYDSGFEGHIGFVIHNDSGRAIIQQGVAIGQIKFIASEGNELYAGGYNHKSGEYNPSK